MESVNDEDRFSFSFYDDHDDYQSDDSCIEICLQPHPALPHQSELRISFSSGLPFMQRQTHHSSQLSLTSYASSSFSSSLSLENHHQQLPCNSRQLPPTRKASKMRGAMNGGGIIKFIIKCGSGSLGPMVASILKPWQVNSTQDDINTGEKKKRAEESIQHYWKLIKHIRKWLVVQKKHDQKGNCYKAGKKLKTDELVMDAQKQSSRKTKSCPTSIKSSPIHNGVANEENKKYTYTRDSSIQAAIAHCKKSSATQLPDFCIPTAPLPG